MNLKNLTILMLGLASAAASGQTFEWARQIGDAATIQYHKTGVDDANNVYCWGKLYMPGTMDINPGPGTYMLPAGSSSFISKVDKNGNFLWGKEINRSVVGGQALGAIDTKGNIYVTGGFLDSILVDPQSDFRLFGTKTNIYIAKWDSAGALIWGKNITDLYSIDKISVGVSGGVVVSGTISKGSTVDFDPGTGTFMLTANELSTYVLKLDAAGNFESAYIWKYGARGYLDEAGNTYVTGELTDSLDADQGPGTFIITPQVKNNSCAFIAKYDPSGQFKWAKILEAKSGAYVDIATLSFDGIGNIYIGGRFSFIVDFDPSAAETLLDAGNTGFMLTTYVAKMNSQGQTFWARKLAIESNPGQASCTDAAGNYYITVPFYQTIDVDPGPATMLFRADEWGMYILKMNPTGELAWATSFQGYIPSPLIHVDHSGDVYSSGLFRGKIDFDPGSDSFNQVPKVYEDMFVLKLSQGDCDDIILGIDSFRDISCSSAGYLSLHARGGQAPYTYTWDTAAHAINDSTAAPAREGIYTISLKDNRNCEKQAFMLIKGPKPGNLPDIQAALTTGGNITPNGYQYISLHLSNDNCISSSGTITLVKDSRVKVEQSTPAPDSVAGDSLIWKFSNVFYHGTPFNPYLLIKADTSLTFQDTLNFGVFAYDAQGDLDSANNEREYVVRVSAAYDPNDLQVNPYGQCTPAYVLKDRKLTYTVRFQNTGNFKATNVFVLDSLSRHLDITTINVIAKSHPKLALEVLPGNVIKFRFDNIELPDSNHNEQGSHGFFVFEISPNANLPEFTTIENRVGIYFDFNAPVMTNTVKNTYISQMPSVTVTRTGNTLTATPGAISYEWVDCSDNSKPVPGADQSTFTPAKNGTYAVRVNMKECSIVSECITIQVTGIGDAFQQQTAVYPNPSNGELSVSLSQFYNRVEVSVSDMQGREVQQYSGAGQNFSFTMATEPGIYLVTVRTNDGQAVFKVIRK